MEEVSAPQPSQGGGNDDAAQGTEDTIYKLFPAPKQT